MDRRSALKTLSLGTLAAATAAPTRLVAQTPPPATPPASAEPVKPGSWSFKIGEWECIALNDGVGRMSPIQPNWAPGAKPEAIERVLKRHFLPTDALNVAFNALLVRGSAGTFLLDSGSGAGARPRNGWMGAHLAALGIEADSIDGVFLSHAHGDHFGGLLDAEGRAVFPKAKLFVSQAEHAFWTAPTPDFGNSPQPEARRAGAVRGAKRVFDALATSTEILKDGQSMAPGLELLSAHGHTPGHSLMRIRSGDEELIYLADLAHHHALMFDQPRWTVAFDVHPDAAAETRVAWFGKLADARTRVHLFHMPFPGVGNIRRLGDESFEWVPLPWTVV